MNRQKFCNKDPVLKELILLILKILTVILVITLLFTYIFGVLRVKDERMIPNINPNDTLFYYRLDRKYLVGETVVYSYNGKNHLARIIATGGDEVDIDGEGLTVNSSRQYEPKIYKETFPIKEGITYPLKLKEDEFFVLADNREMTEDSRLFGGIKKGQIKGKAFILIRKNGI